MGSPMQCSNTRQEFWKSEWLHKVVVGTGIETAHPVIHRTSRGKNQYRSPETASTHLAQSLKTALARQHDIQEDQVKRRISQLPDTRLSGIGHSYLVAVAFQPFGDCTSQLALVFYD